MIADSENTHFFASDEPSLEFSLESYKNLEIKRGYKETDQLGGLDPYSASKVGAEIGSAITKLNGVELLILLDSGKYISIIQEAGDKNFMSGQAVKIIRSGGKSRVLPRN